jgi:hypothetical protein
MPSTHETPPLTMGPSATTAGRSAPTPGSTGSGGLPVDPRRAAASAGEQRVGLADLFDASERGVAEPLLVTDLFARSRATLPERGTLLRDDFAGAGGVSCLFVRLRHPSPAGVRFAVDGSYEILSCAAGGWLLKSGGEAAPSFWIPQPPMLRTVDAQGRILQERPSAIAALAVSSRGLAVTVAAFPGHLLDWVIWRIPPEARGLCAELEQLSSLEKARTYVWSSQAAFGRPADLYLHLIEGAFYQNAWAWPRKWKFCCELDACEIFVWLRGLERATGKRLYGLLRRQILLSVMARQSADGGWYHGEWTDGNECHYRFHNGALSLLENALDEWDDAAVRESLARGAAFVAARTDKTDLGLWFLHDSLEESAAAMDAMYRQTGTLVPGFGAWKPTRFLGKSPTNKMILNTHVDTTVALDRYGAVCADPTFGPQVQSARLAVRRLLALRPADPVYRIAYRAVRWTLLPAARAARLPLPVRALKRLTWMYLVPNLYRLKHAFPRIVMPGGLIDRHLAPLHFDAKYHAVNVLDLVRLWRRFPEEDLGRVIDEAVRFVMADDESTLRWWAESPPRRFAVVVFAEALYHLCLLDSRPQYRKHLAAAVLLAEELGLGLPPSVLGGNAEIATNADQVPCPSPADPRLRVANLSTRRRAELLVINPSHESIELTWETDPPEALSWGPPASNGAADGRRIAPRGWLWGRAPDPH